MLLLVLFVQKFCKSPLLFLFHWTPIDPFCVLHFISFGKLKRKYTLSMFLMEESFIIQAFVRFGIPIQFKFFYDMVWNWFLCQAGSVLPGSSVIGFCFISFFQVRGVGWVIRLGLAILFFFSGLLLEPRLVQRGLNNADVCIKWELVFRDYSDFLAQDKSWLMRRFRLPRAVLLVPQRVEPRETVHSMLVCSFCQLLGSLEQGHFRGSR